jgi:hypothetical protein
MLDWEKLTAKVKQLQDAPASPAVCAVVIHASEPVPVRASGTGHHTVYGVPIIHATKFGGQPVQPDYAILVYQHGGTVEHLPAIMN